MVLTHGKCLRLCGLRGVNAAKSIVRGISLSHLSYSTLSFFSDQSTVDLIEKLLMYNRKPRRSRSLIASICVQIHTAPIAHTYDMPLTVPLLFFYLFKISQRSTSSAHLPHLIPCQSPLSLTPPDSVLPPAHERADKRSAARKDQIAQANQKYDDMRKKKEAEGSSGGVGGKGKSRAQVARGKD